MNLCLTVESCALCSTDECVVDLTWTDLVDATSSSNSSSVIKPWHERQDLTNYVESDPDDEQLLLRVPFTANVKLRSISILGEGGDQAPKQLKVYINRPELDFSDVLDDATEPVQTLDLVQSREVVDYSVRPAKFSNIQHLTLFFSQNFADDSESQTRIYYVGFKGESSGKIVNSVKGIVYEAQANPAGQSHVRVHHWRHDMLTVFFLPRPCQDCPKDWRRCSSRLLKFDLTVKSIRPLSSYLHVHTSFLFCLYIIASSSYRTKLQCAILAV